MLKFNVKNQIIERLDDFRVVADSKNYLTADFMLSDEWDNKKVFASFSHMDVDIAKEAEIKDGQCLVPWEVIKPPFFSVSLFCGDLITSNVVSVQVEASGLKNGEPAGTPTPTVWAQYVKEIERYAAELAAQMIGIRTPEGGTILGDLENNVAAAPFTLSAGNGCIAGMRGYYYSNIDFSGENPVITLSRKQTEAETEAFEIGYSVGDVVSFVNNSKYPDCATITEINGNVITVDSLPFNVVEDMSEKLASDDYSVFVAEKPLAGDVPLGYGAFVAGEDAIAYERAAAAFGRLTKALGQYSFVANRETIAGYCAAAFNRGSQAPGHGSFAINDHTIARGSGSFAANKGTIAAAYQAAFGKYNIEDIAKEFALILGNGTSDTDRKNMLTVDWKGNLWTSGEIRSGDSKAITEKDVNDALESFIATYTAKELVAGITAEVGVKFIYDEEDIDTFSIVVDETAVVDKIPITEKARIAAELLKAEKTRFIFYNGDDAVYTAKVKSTLPNRGMLLIEKG